MTTCASLDLVTAPPPHLPSARCCCRRPCLPGRSGCAKDTLEAVSRPACTLAQASPAAHVRVHTGTPSSSHTHSLSVPHVHLDCNAPLRLSWRRHTMPQHVHTTCVLTILFTHRFLPAPLPGLFMVPLLHMLYYTCALRGYLTYSFKQLHGLGSSVVCCCALLPSRCVLLRPLTTALCAAAPSNHLIVCCCALLPSRCVLLRPLTISLCAAAPPHHLVV